MSTPDPRRGDEPGAPTTPAPSPNEREVTEAFEEHPANQSEPGDEPAVEQSGPNEPVRVTEPDDIPPGQ